MTTGKETDDGSKKVLYLNKKIAVLSIILVVKMVYCKMSSRSTSSCDTAGWTQILTIYHFYNKDNEFIISSSPTLIFNYNKHNFEVQGFCSGDEKTLSRQVSHLNSEVTYLSQS